MANQLRERCIDAEIIKENHKKDSGRNPGKKLYLKLYYHVKHELCVGKSSQKPEFADVAQLREKYWSALKESVIDAAVSQYLNYFKENDNTLKFAKHVLTETSVIFS